MTAFQPRLKFHHVTNLDAVIAQTNSNPNNNTNNDNENQPPSASGGGGGSGVEVGTSSQPNVVPQSPSTKFTVQQKLFSPLLQRAMGSSLANLAQRTGSPMLSKTSTAASQEPLPILNSLLSFGTNASNTAGGGGGGEEDSDKSFEFSAPHFFDFERAAAGAEEEDVESWFDHNIAGGEDEFGIPLEGNEDDYLLPSSSDNSPFPSSRASVSPSPSLCSASSPSHSPFAANSHQHQLRQRPLHLTRVGTTTSTSTSARSPAPPTTSKTAARKSTTTTPGTKPSLSSATSSKTPSQPVLPLKKTYTPSTSISTLPLSSLSSYQKTSAAPTTMTSSTMTTTTKPKTPTVTKSTVTASSSRTLMTTKTPSTKAVAPSIGSKPVATTVAPGYQARPVAIIVPKTYAVRRVPAATSSVPPPTAKASSSSSLTIPKTPNFATSRLKRARGEVLPSASSMLTASSLQKIKPKATAEPPLKRTKTTTTTGSTRPPTREQIKRDRVGAIGIKNPMQNSLPLRKVTVPAPFLFRSDGVGLRRRQQPTASSSSSSGVSSTVPRAHKPVASASSSSSSSHHPHSLTEVRPFRFKTEVRAALHQQTTPTSSFSSSFGGGTRPPFGSTSVGRTSLLHTPSSSSSTKPQPPLSASVVRTKTLTVPHSPALRVAHRSVARP